MYLEFRQNYAAALSGFCFILQRASILFLFILIFKLAHKYWVSSRHFHTCATLHRHSFPSLCSLPPLWLLPFLPHNPPSAFMSCVFHYPPLSLQSLPPVSGSLCSCITHAHTHREWTHMCVCVCACTHDFLRLGLVQFRLTSNLKSEDGSELLAFLSLTSMCWDYRPVLP